MHLKSTTGAINVLVLNQDEDVTTSVLVPTPKCPRTSGEHTHARQIHEMEVESETSPVDVDTPVERDRDRHPATVAQGDATQLSSKERATEETDERSRGEGTGSRSDGKQVTGEVKSVAAESETGGRRLRSGRVTKPLHQLDDLESPLPMDISSNASQDRDPEEVAGASLSSSQQQRSLAAIVERLHKDRGKEGEGGEGDGASEGPREDARQQEQGEDEFNPLHSQTILTPCVL